MAILGVVEMSVESFAKDCWCSQPKALHMWTEVAVVGGEASETIRSPYSSYILGLLVSCTYELGMDAQDGLPPCIRSVMEVVMPSNLPQMQRDIVSML